VISWFYIPVKREFRTEIILRDSWPEGHGFCMIREEPELLTDIPCFTILFFVIFRRKSSEWSDSSIESNLGIRFPIWSLDLAIPRDFAFFKHCFECKNRLSKRVSYLHIFVIRENEILISVIRDPWSSIFSVRARETPCTDCTNLCEQSYCVKLRPLVPRPCLTL